MKVFHCDHCGHLLFFENTQCVRCGQLVAYLPDLAIVGSLESNNDQAGDHPGTWRSPLAAAGGRAYRLCRNYTLEQVCNWAIPDGDPNPLCLSCRLTRVIPDLWTSDRRQAWYRLEVAKRRLVFTLLRLALPIISRDDDPEHGLAFEFKADEPNGAAVLTGHAGGLITINIAEADDAERERRRRSLHEPFRTLAGHFRHESGHYYWDRLIADRSAFDGFRRCIRRRTIGLRQRAGRLLRARPARGLAGALHQRLRERASSRGLGRDLGALPPHGRHGGDDRRLRRLPSTAAIG